MQNGQSSLEVVSSMEAQTAFEDASHVHSASSSAVLNPEQTHETEEKTRELEGSDRAPATPNAKAAADLLAPSDLTPSLESHFMKKSGSKCSPIQIEVEDESSASSATASPPGTGHAPPSAQRTHAKASAQPVASEHCKDKKKLCEYPGCSVQPTFNFPGERGGSHCATHRLEGQINTVNKMCEVPGCFVRPSFKFPHRGTASQRCARHKLPGMVGNSGKLPASPVNTELITSADEEVKIATPKRARGELLRIQREQLMQILGDSAVTNSSADCESRIALSPQDSASATSSKRVKHCLASQPAANKAEPTAVTSSDCKKEGAGVWLVEQDRWNNAPLASDTLPATPKKVASAEVVKTVADSDILNSSAYLVAQPPNVFPFLTHCGVPVSVASSANSEDHLTPQHSFQAAMLPVNSNTASPYSALTALDFNQALLALSAFNQAMWCPINPFAAYTATSTPIIPSLNPWAAAVSSMPFNLHHFDSPSLLLNPAASSTQNNYSQLAQNPITALPVSVACPSHQAMIGLSSTPNLSNNASNHVDIS